MASINSLVKSNKPYAMPVYHPEMDDNGDFPFVRNSKGKVSKIVFNSPDSIDEITEIKADGERIYSDLKKKYARNGDIVSKIEEEKIEKNMWIKILMACVVGYENVDGEDDKPLKFAPEHFKDLITNSPYIFETCKMQVSRHSNFMIGSKPKKEKKS